MEDALRRGLDQVVIVAHGGTQMSVMEHFALPHRPYEQWHTGNGCGHMLDAAPWTREHKLRWLGTVCYADREVAR